MKRNKKVVEGSLVTIHGDKIIRASRISRSCGVWADSTQRVMLTDKGFLKVNLPEGIVVQGRYHIKSNGEDRERLKKKE